MGLFRKDDIWFSYIRLKGIDQGLYLCLNATYDRKAYNDYLTLERSLGRGQGTEVMYKIPFSDIISFSFKRSLFGMHSIMIQTKSKNTLFSDMKADRDLFNASPLKKMKKIINKYKKNNP